MPGDTDHWARGIAHRATPGSLSRDWELDATMRGRLRTSLKGSTAYQVAGNGTAMMRLKKCVARPLMRGLSTTSK